MIASLIVTLDAKTQDTIDQISGLPGVEIGTVNQDAARLPITIDSADPNALEEITRSLQECPGVAFVDVVFVHFEEARHARLKTENCFNG